MSATGPLEVIRVAAELYRCTENNPNLRDTKFVATMAKDLIENRPNLVHTTSMLGTARASFDCAAYKLLESALNVYKLSGGE